MSVPFYGDYDTTETVYIPFNTFDSNDPTASVTITNLVAGDVEIHKDGGTTQRSSDSGVTVSINFDTVTGNHLVSIDLSDNADAGFYANGSRYQVRMEGTTVDGGTINAWIGSFSIGCTLRPTTAGRTLDIQSTGEVDANLTMIGANTQSATDLKDFADAGYDPSTNKVEGVKLVDTTTTNTDMVSAAPTAAQNADAVWDEAKSGHVGVGSFGEEVQLHSLSSEVSALNDISAAEVNAECDQALVDYDGPTKTEMDSAFTEIKGATWSSLTDTLEAIRDRGDAEWLTATGFSTHSASDIWAVATRALTDKAGFTISGAKTTLDALNDLTAAQVNAECDQALADYDPPTKAELDAGLAALNDISVADLITGIADGSYDLQEMIRIIFAAVSGKSTGGGTATVNFRNSEDTKNRIVATVDANNNRTSVTLDGS